MRPSKSDVVGNRGLHVTKHRQVAAPGGGTAVTGVSSESAQSPRSGQEPRLNRRLRLLLSQKRGPDTVMIIALSAALLCGLIGFALNFMWVVAIIAMALALGFVVADSRRNRIDIANQRDEDADG